MRAVVVFRMGFLLRCRVYYFIFNYFSERPYAEKNQDIYITVSGRTGVVGYNQRHLQL